MQIFFRLVAVCAVLGWIVPAARAARPPINDPLHLLGKPLLFSKVRAGPVARAPGGLRGKAAFVAGATGPDEAIPATVTFDDKPVRTRFVPFRAKAREFRLLMGPLDPVKKPYTLPALVPGNVIKLTLGGQAVRHVEG